jgi:hypothetical protein
MKVTKSQLKRIIKEEIESLEELGLGQSLKNVGGALKAKAWDTFKGTDNLGQSVEAKKQITAMVQELVQSGYGGDVSGHRQRVAEFLQQLAAQVVDAPSAGA